MLNPVQLLVQMNNCVDVGVKEGLFVILDAYRSLCIIERFWYRYIGLIKLT